MFCYQCEQTDRSGAVPGCQLVRGTCGKDETTADLQDLLIHVLKGIGQYATRARALGVGDDAAADFVLYGMFTTLTNVNFTATRFVQLIAEAARIRDRVRAAYLAAALAQGSAPEELTGPAGFVPAARMDLLLQQAVEVGVRRGVETVGEDVVGLRALILYGLKGVCAYAHHAAVLGVTDPEVFGAAESTLDFLAGDPTDVPALLDRALALGRVNLRVMELLDAANTGTYGMPEVTSVRTAPLPGKAILVSGHDLRDLAAILEQTKDLGVNVYTNGELLPAHAYPVLRNYPHLAGNYGGAWQDQQSDFARFPGAIVMTSNCIIEPQASYRSRIFTTGPVGWPGIRHLGAAAGSSVPHGQDRVPTDFRPAIKAALALPGFTEDDAAADGPNLTVGFARQTVLGAADAVVQAVKDGDIRHFFLIGGCDGPTPGRNYFTDFATSTPADTVVMTLGCAKYRFNNHDFGAVAGLPRLLDIGQCNDSYSAIKVAVALAEAFDCGVNDLPLSLVLSWLEQKAAAVLLTLLALGIQGIRIGPSLPAFLTPTAVGVLVEQFGLAPIGDPVEDLAACLA